MSKSDPKNVKKLIADHAKAKKPTRAEQIKAAKQMRTIKPTKKGEPKSVLALIARALRNKE